MTTDQPPYRPRDEVARAAAITVALIVAAGCGFYWLHSQGDIGQPLTCAEQYANWKSGAAGDAAGKAQADSRALDDAARYTDITGIVSALEAVGADAGALEAYPMPACADPAGYWPQVLAELKAAGGNAGTSSGLGALMLAAAPLKGLPATAAKLDAELKRTAGAAVPFTAPVNTAAPSASATPALPTAVTIPTPSAVPAPTLATVAPATIPAPTLATMATVPAMAT